MRYRIFFIAALCSSPALAQVANPTAPDLSQYMPRSESTASIATLNASIAAAQSAANNAVAAIPATCASVPSPDTPDGTAGSSTPCTPRSDARRPANGLWTRATTDGSCNLGWTFGRTFTTPVISIATQDTGMPVLWSITSISGTAVMLKAYRLQLLPSSLTLVTNLQSFNVTAGTCTGIVAHIGVREQLVP